MIFSPIDVSSFVAGTGNHNILIYAIFADKLQVYKTLKQWGKSKHPTIPQRLALDRISNIPLHGIFLLFTSATIIKKALWDLPW
jgi:hypothetical protein